MKKASQRRSFFCTGGETPFGCAQDKLLVSPIFKKLQIHLNEKSLSKEKLFCCTGGETPFGCAQDKLLVSQIFKKLQIHLNEKSLSKEKLFLYRRRDSLRLRSG